MRGKPEPGGPGRSSVLENEPENSLPEAGVHCTRIFDPSFDSMKIRESYPYGFWNAN